MSQETSNMEANNWKQQYYEQLDLLDQKEKDWQALESILKKTVLRLSITAEGQHATIDRHLHDIRTVVKKQVNVIQLENILDDLSALLLKIGDKQVAADRKVTTMLMRLLEEIDFPDSTSTQKNSLIKKLSRSSDKDSDVLAAEVQDLLSVSINSVADSSHVQVKTGLLKNLFRSHDNTDSQSNDTINDSKTGEATNYDSIVDDFARFVEALPWPDSLEKEANKALAKLTACNHRDINKQLDSLFSLVNKWQQQSAAKQSNCAVISNDTETVSPLVSDMHNLPGAPDLAAASHKLQAEQSELSAQKILIRLLQQLTVPPDLYEVVESLKLRIDVERSATGWKRLLNDVAHLINTLRNRMQEEKQEFETFLQQITGRLKEMDSFLLTENTALNEAEQAGGTFDAVVSAQVQDIHNDMNTVDNLKDLKNKVEKRLSVVSDHIKQYRVNEQARYINAQQNVENMQSRMHMLEQETGDLRKLILVKNKEAMIDVLTDIPNRLSYEKKAVEEIARCNRFAIPMSMAVWDVDLFKQVNDTHGHKVGDIVLKSIAQLLSQRMRETDFIARYGGEEFVMFLPGADEARALAVADKLRERISACKFKHHDEIVSITVSCGITSFIEGDSHESMFERADKALYAAKQSGRNKCLVASSLSEKQTG